MWRIALVSVLACGLMGLLLYSQTRHEPLRVSGFIEADEIRLGSRVGGRVKEVLVEEGQAVVPGDILIRLEEFDLDERQMQARAELAAREAEHRRLQSGYRTEEKAQAAARAERLRQKHKALLEGARPEEKEAAKARLRLSQSQYDLAKITFDRNSGLFEREKGTVSREVLDRSTEDLKGAQANRDMREQEWRLIENGTRAEDLAAAAAELEEAEQARLLTENGFRAEDIEQAQAAVDSAKAALAVLEAQREELEVRSPVAGSVEVVELRPGDLVGASAPVLSVIDTHHLWVRAFVPENQMGIAIGQKFRVTVDSFPGQSFEGTVTFLSRQAEFTPSNVQTPEERSKQVFRMKVDLPPDPRLRPGMAVDVWLESS